MTGALGTLADHRGEANLLMQCPGLLQEELAETKLQDLRTGQGSLVIENLQRITAVCFSPDGRWLLTGSEDNALRVFDLVSPLFNARGNHDDPPEEVYDDLPAVEQDSSNGVSPLLYLGLALTSGLLLAFLFMKKRS